KRDGTRMLSIGDAATCIEASDPDDHPQPEYAFRSFSELKDLEEDTMVDAIGVVVRIGDLIESDGTDDRKVYGRTILLLEDTHHVVSVMFWGQRAADFDQGLRVNIGDVMAIRSATCKEYRAEYNLYVTNTSDIEVNPTNERSRALCKW